MSKQQTINNFSRIHRDAEVFGERSVVDENLGIVAVNLLHYSRQQQVGRLLIVIIIVKGC